MIHYGKECVLAKFKFIYWLVEFLLSGEDFVFDWNEGNLTKSEDKHGITPEMVESAFQDESMLVLGEQYQPIVNEDRYGVVAKCSTGEHLFICFTIRFGMIRPISTRLANKKERSSYDD